MKRRFDSWSLLVFAFLLLCASLAHSQVPVAMAPPIHFQFLNSSGQPLANGKVYTYSAGTTTCLNTYVDASGTTQNPCILLLDATGSPTNGTNQVGIFLANSTYKFVAYDSNNVLQWSVDNVSTYFGLLNSTNTWSLAQTFSGQIIDTLTDNQIALGAGGNQTTLDAPPPTGNVTLHFPSTSDTLVGRNTTDTLANKTLTTPLFNSSGCGIVNGPGTYVCVANANPTGTSLNALTILANAPSQATIALTSTTGGVIGVCTSGCANTGTATIQQSGTALCVFDGATFAGDYVQISSTVGGDCHDATAIFPTSGQVIGRVLSNNAGAGIYSVDLFSPETQTGYQPACSVANISNCTGDQTGVSGGASASFSVVTTGYYRIGCYLIVTTVATTSSTLPSCQIQWTDPDNSFVQTIQVTATNTGNTATTMAQGFAFIHAKAGSNINWSTQGYASSGATSMLYAVHVRAFPD